MSELKLIVGNKNYSSWSLRPWVLLKALDIPFTEHQHYFTPDNSAFKSFSPTALVPALIDGKQTIWDSLAIAEYVYEDHPAVWPASREARSFARSAAAEMHSGFSALRSLCSMNVGVRVKMFDTPPALIRDLARIDDIWRYGFTNFGGPYIAGSTFTAVDAFYAPVVFRSNNREAQAHMCRMGAGLAVLPCRLAAQIDGLEPVDLGEVPPPRNLYFGYHRDLGKLARLRALVQLVAERLSD